MKIRAIVKRPDEAFGHMTNISCSLENLQRLVGGYIEVVDLGPGLAILCNEEGKIQRLTPNMHLGSDVLVGDIVIIGTKGEEFCDIPISFATWKGIVRRYNPEVGA